MDTNKKEITKIPTKSYKRVYVWQLPVRIFHWANVVAILVLSVTGFIIGDPPALMSQSEAWNTFLFAKVKVIHFIAAYVFFGVMILRFYWAFVGNEYAHWTAFLPFNRDFTINKKAIGNIWHVIKYDVLLMKEKKHNLSDISIGHNYMATSAYVIMFFVGLALVFTGFGLYSDLSSWWLPKLFSWVPDLLGGDFVARQIHRISMWLIILFIIIHIYLVLFHGWLHARGEVSAMISGFKFVRTERVKKTGIDFSKESDEDSDLNYDENNKFKNKE